MLSNIKGMHLTLLLIQSLFGWIQTAAFFVFCLWPKVNFDINDPKHSLEFKSVCDSSIIY